MTHQEKLEHDRRLWKKKVEEFKASGLSATDFAKANNISVHQFHYWKDKFGGKLKNLPPQTSKISPVIKVIPSHKLQTKQLPDPQWLADFLKALL